MRAFRFGGLLATVIGLAAMSLPCAAGQLGTIMLNTDDGTLSGPVRDAVLLAKASGGQVALAGSTLATGSTGTEDEVVVIKTVALEKMKPGEIVMLARDGCTQTARCLMARQIVEVDRAGAVRTASYGHPQVEAAKGIDASVMGRVTYAIDLKTGRIRDLRGGGEGTSVTLAKALAQEAGRRFKYKGNVVRDVPRSI